MLRKLLAVLILVTVPAAAAPGPWKSAKPAPATTRLKKGKTVRSWASPDKKSTLVYRDEGEKGDFFWNTVYVKRGTAYTALETCNEIENVRWRPDSSAVTFHMWRAVGPSEQQRVEMEYRPATRALRSRVVGKRHVEAAG